MSVLAPHMLCLLPTGQRDSALTHQGGLVHEQDAGVGLKIDSRRLLHYLQALDRDICLIGQAEAYEVQHLDEQ